MGSGLVHGLGHVAGETYVKLAPEACLTSKCPSIPATSKAATGTA
jgi:hypothetical protein